MTFLIDTNVISELVRRNPNPGVLFWADSVSSVDISAVTVEEIFFGLSWRPNQRIQEGKELVTFYESTPVRHPWLLESMWLAASSTRGSPRRSRRHVAVSSTGSSVSVFRAPGTGAPTWRHCAGAEGFP